VEHFDAAIATDPSVGLYHAEKGRALLESGCSRFEEAGRSFDAALAQEPRSEEFAVDALFGGLDAENARSRWLLGAPAAELEALTPGERAQLRGIKGRKLEGEMAALAVELLSSRAKALLDSQAADSVDSARRLYEEALKIDGEEEEAQYGLELATVRLNAYNADAAKTQRRHEQLQAYRSKALMLQEGRLGFDKTALDEIRAAADEHHGGSDRMRSGGSLAMEQRSEELDACFRAAGAELIDGKGADAAPDAALAAAFLVLLQCS